MAKIKAKAAAVVAVQDRRHDMLVAVAAGFNSTNGHGPFIVSGPRWQCLRDAALIQLLTNSSPDGVTTNWPVVGASPVSLSADDFKSLMVEVLTWLVSWQVYVDGEVDVAPSN